MASGPRYQLFERRHLPDRLGGEHLHQSVHVVVFERRDVAGQPVLGVRRIRCGEPIVGAGPRGLQLPARPLQQAVDRSGAGADRVGYFGRLPLQHVVKQQRCPLTWRQVLQRRDERQPDRFARPDDVGWVGDIGQRLQPRDFDPLHHLGRRIRAGRAEPGGQRPALPALECGQAGVGGDAMQPGSHRRLALEAVVGFPGTQIGFLHQIFGIV
ncbi:hypothetical protein MSP7336_00885 [Mycobacterium shimoidei]|uniref:Uncharacterized protein n=1 Tax=Mycobacterium shimoidei TaxID=29313 RepID=A0A375YV00_MYCSH|nr:hypothetical protein MSP7336_00885 [Mycobacterium shimoidei]